VILISHPDADHFNGLEKIIERFDVGVVLVSPYMFVKRTSKKIAENDNPNDDTDNPNNTKKSEIDRNFEGVIRLRELLQERKIPVVEIASGDDLIAYGLPESAILHPPRDGFETEESNVTSVVLQFAHNRIRILLPADLDGKLRSPFLSLPPTHCDVMMVPHHGGNSKETEPLLKWATPNLLIINDGGFTHRTFPIEQYQKQNKTVHSTRDNGYIKIIIDKTGLQEKTLNKKSRHHKVGDVK
jgi:competence protein ComEC